MFKRHRFPARKWLQRGEYHWVHTHNSDATHGRALVEDLYRAGALNVEVGVATETGRVADILFVKLPEGRDEALKVMALLAWQHGDEVELCEEEEDVVRVWWD